MVLQYIIIAYKLICILCAIYCWVVQAEWYHQSKDTSIVTFKPFTEKPEDYHPDVTICIEEAQFKSHVLDEFLLSEKDISLILRGDLLISATNGSFDKIEVLNSFYYMCSYWFSSPLGIFRFHIR